jgi:membrane associated rhomboid family serine protease
MGDDRSAERAFSQARPEGRPQPIATYGVMAVTVFISLLTLLGSTELESWLYLDKAAVYYDSEYWRLLTVALVHDSNLPIHLIFNMYALFIIGPIIEALYGPRRFLLIYLICIAAGSVASYATSPVFGVGASGGVFGLFGALIVADRVHKPALTRNARNLTMQIGVLIGINLFIGFSLSGIDNAAHIGGLIAGAILGFLIVPQGARLDSFWSRPSGDPVSPTGQAIDPVARTRPLRVLGVIGVVAGILALVVVGPVTYTPPPWWLLAGQPLAVAEALGQTVAVAAGQASMVLGRRRLAAVGDQRQVEHEGPPGLTVRALVPQEQAQPRGHAATQPQSSIDRSALDRIRPAEGIAA